MFNRSLASAVVREGVGIHSGQPVRCELRPADFGAGVLFVTPEGRVPATVAHARAVPGATVVGGVSTPEHLLAALSALGVTDVEVHCAVEVPALDGSAAGWVAAIDEAGRVDGPVLDVPEVRPARVEAAGGVAWAEAGPDTLRVEVDYEGGPRGVLEVLRTEEAFRAEVAWARTFVLARDVERLRAAGRGRGASAENTVVWDGGGSDEPVRHKLLDLWGDLALLGPVRGRVVAVRGSHALHHALIRRAR